MENFCYFIKQREELGKSFIPVLLANTHCKVKKMKQKSSSQGKLPIYKKVNIWFYLNYIIPWWWSLEANLSRITLNLISFKLSLEQFQIEISLAHPWLKRHGKVSFCICIILKFCFQHHIHEQILKLCQPKSKPCFLGYKNRKNVTMAMNFR
jgi:hypothetical protein